MLLVIGIWIRLSLKESPLFLRIKQAGGSSRSPLTEAFGRWRNLRLVSIALFGLVAGQAVVWYTGQFQALFFLTLHLKVDDDHGEPADGVALALGTPLFVVFGALSDRIGRKPIILAGCLLAALGYLPLFEALTGAANPALAEAQDSVSVTLSAAPQDCTWQFNPLGVTRHEQRVRRGPAAAVVARGALHACREHGPDARDDRRVATSRSPVAASTIAGDDASRAC